MCPSRALEQAQLSAQCEPDDVVCAALGLEAPIAAGATLPVEVAVTSPGVATPITHLETARTDIATVEDHAITGVGAGMTALVVSTKGGVVLDFVHVFVADPTRVGVRRLDGDVSAADEIDSRIQLLSGDEVVLAAAPYRGHDRLLG